MTENPANGIKDMMWHFLMDKGQKENVLKLIVRMSIAVRCRLVCPLICDQFTDFNIQIVA